MRQSCNPYVAAAIVACGALAGEAAAQTTVYSAWGNTVGWDLITDVGETASDQESPGGGENDSQVAEDVTLAGTARFVTRFDLRIGRPPSYTGTPPTITTRLRFFAIGPGGLPADVLWEGLSTPTTLLTGSLTPTPLTFTPNVLVPDSFFFAVSFALIVGPTSPLGPVFVNSAPSIGSTSPDHLYQDSTTGLWSTAAPTGLPFFNAQAMIVAVPSPAAAVPLLVLSAVARRRRR